jgi:hypothetical protein
VPRQLPLAVPDFIGRVEQLAFLDAVLPDTNLHTRNGSADGSGTVVISAVDGTAELLNVVAVSLNAIHERAAALDCWRRAVATFDVYDYPRAVEIRDRIHDLDQPSPREKQSGS